MQPLTQFYLLKMKAHEENLAKKEKSTEDKAKETGKIPFSMETFTRCVYPTETKLRILINAVYLKRNSLYSYLSAIRNLKNPLYSIYFKRSLGLFANSRW